MKTKSVVGIRPSVIRWARESIGLSPEEVAHRLKRQVEEVLAWESGDQAPTYPQLEKLAYQIYKRPLAVFFLPEPPQETQPKTEFRTLPLADLNELLPDTRMHIRKAHAYQLALTEVFNENPSSHKVWKDFYKVDEQNISKFSGEVRGYLGISIETQLNWKQPDAALKAWRRAIEDKGVFVFKAAFKQKDISGFCLSHDQFPVIYLNNSTTKSRQVFSLLHELCHLFLHENGISKFDNTYINDLPGNVQMLERLCNAVAASILIPPNDFESQSNHLPFEIEDVDDSEIESLANRYAVSREVILRRFLDQNRVSPHYYRQKAGVWASQKKKGTGGDWYASTKSYLSERFAQEVVSQHYRNKISVEQASELLGIKSKNFEGLEQRILQGAIT